MRVKMNNSSATPLSLIVLLCLSLLPVMATAAANAEKKCLYVSSYHRGYAWSDGVERGLRAVLAGHCEIRQFDMDTKRNKAVSDKQQAASRARQIIEQWQPDIVITADDNAARYLLQPYYRDSELPFVFCGINWTAKEYGLPYTNATGIIEVAPIRPLLQQVRALLGTVENAVYIGADTVTENKNYRRFAKIASQEGIRLRAELADSQTAWLQAYHDAQQQADFVVIGSNAGIEQWDRESVVQHISGDSHRLSVTNHDWMMPYTMLGFTKVPEEQGELAGRVALSILGGASPSSIAIVPNRKWDMWTNRSLLDSAGISLPRQLLRKSKQVQ